MNTKLPWYELVDRAQNFHNNIVLFEKDNIGYKFFYERLYDLKEELIKELDEVNELTGEIVLKTVLEEVYDFSIKQDLFFENFENRSVFGGDVVLYDSVFEACSYTALCMFLHNTTRIKGKTLREFVYQNSLADYKSHCSIENKCSGLSEEEVAVRKMRNRILSQREVNDERKKWQAVSKDSEYEWSLYFGMSSFDVKLQDTYKRMGNLYNDINKVRLSARDEKYESRRGEALKKFSSKLNKIKYEDYLELQKAIAGRIKENRDYYGMNIYRFEKEIGLYKITNEVKRLLACKNTDEEMEFLVRSSCLSDIFFPKLYASLIALDVDRICQCVLAYHQVRNYIVSSSLLIFDELIEKGYFGKEWEKLFLDIINKNAENVFYSPDDIDYVATPESQEKFHILLEFSAMFALDTNLNFPDK